MRSIDLTGQAFGLLTAVAVAEPRGTRRRWLCQCRCGATRLVDTANLRTGHTRSCGCIDAVDDLVGQRFGRLVVISRAPDGTRGSSLWHCQCDCSAKTIAGTSRLRSGRVVSCGCYRRTMSITHGATIGLQRFGHEMREHRIWRKMRERCYDPKHVGFPRYGGRGITICDRWRDSFANFLADMGPCPPGYSIDRKENDGHYEPGNCRWATYKEQALNSRPRQRKPPSMHL